MSKLTSSVIACGLCHKCGAEQVTAISEAEAKAIVEVCKAEFIEAIMKEQLNGEVDCPEDTAYTNALDNAIKAIQEVM